MDSRHLRYCRVASRAIVCRDRGARGLSDCAGSAGNAERERTADRRKMGQLEDGSLRHGINREREELVAALRSGPTEVDERYRDYQGDRSRSAFLPAALSKSNISRRFRLLEPFRGGRA